MLTAAPFRNIAPAPMYDFGVDKRRDLEITLHNDFFAPSDGSDGKPATKRRPAVAAYGLGPLPSGMPPPNEARFLANEVVFQWVGHCHRMRSTP